MKIYVFGNKDNKQDKVAFEIAQKLTSLWHNQKIEFIEIKPNQDLDFANERKIILMDAVLGLKDVALLENLDQLALSPRNSVHDFDLAFQLKYLKKLGKIESVKIIGIPMKGKINLNKIIKIIEEL
ncbi:hypothetical protein GYA19_01675 [Candidatus Beckwithbacteria bacterium]|nr:hypothetical protein [Candidatus Beckwithbacteria bacterium]